MRLYLQRSIFKMLAAGLVLGLVGLAAAQFPPKPEGVTVLKSKFHENVTISFKEPGICETTKGVKSYAGHVRLPPGFLDDVNGEKQQYPVNTFFWFFEARHDPENAPLAIWLNGGPGGSSLMGLLQENGPCLIAEDSKTAYLNPWSWNNHVNMLYIDEPNQVGLSYDTPTNFTVLLGRGDEGEDVRWVPTDFSEEAPELNLTTRAGTFASQKPSHTLNSTASAAHALWHFAQTFFFEFPHYKPNDDRVSLWAESYGGHYGPGFMRFFQQQNEKIRNGTSEVEHAHYIHLDTLGIVNGLLDAVIQEEAYISFPFNNTYGIQAYNQSVYEELMHNFTRPGGCREQMLECQKRLDGFDVATVNRLSSSSSSSHQKKKGDGEQKPHHHDVCDNVQDWCQNRAVTLYSQTDHGWFDITHPKSDPFPPPHMHGYLTEASVLGALGSPVNFTAASGVVARNFESTNDIAHGGFLDAVAYLLDTGVKVHMMYGDRDYACNWVGGELVSTRIPYARLDGFKQAGYAPLLTSQQGTGDGSVGGMTRQFGNYSFTRIYQAGHEVPMYQPVAAYDLFMRATFNRDIATGLLPVHDELSTVGPSDTWHIKNVPLPRPEPKCYVIAPDTCTDEVWAKVAAGEVEVKDYFVVGDKKTDVGVSGDGEL
ncbi:serine carboxypeptidase [Purpureocillium lavendulum]|uniref:Serine carboxypeptidase n=1 Tax=Purpureocillium lavendulum TaxID=1247861 RepID=A0AB34G0R8_9HYPO|nr:serine carboxypeptidase [Purpureocillium lavendulum]